MIEVQRALSESAAFDLMQTRRGRAKRAGAVLAFVVCVIACGAFAGWTAGLQVLTHWGSHPASLKPLTAFGLLVSGLTIVATIRLRARGTDGAIGWAAAAGAWTVVALGAACVAMNILGVGGAVDAATGSMTSPALLLRPSPATSVALLACGVGLVMLRLRPRWAVWGRWGAALTVGAIAGVSIMGYAFDIAEVYRSAPYRTMALPTAISLALLSIAMSLAQPEYGLVAVVLRDDAGGQMARRLLPFVGPLTLAVCWGAQFAVEIGAMGGRSAMAAVAVSLASIGSLAVGMTARWLGESDAARRVAERRIRLLFAELDHRVRNIITAALSICEQTASESRTLDEFMKSYTPRLRAIARAHEVLSANRWEGVSVRRLAQTIVGAYAMVDGRLEIVGDEVVLPRTAAMSLALVINELATNAVKHGAWSSDSGRVRLSWRVDAADELELDWQESGGPVPKGASRSGFGFGLIRGIIGHELGGEVELLLEPPGLSCRIRASLRRARERSESTYTTAA